MTAYAILAAVCILAVVGPLWVLHRDLQAIRDQRERSQEAFLGVAQSIADTVGQGPWDRLETAEDRLAEVIAETVAMAAKVDALPHTWEEMYHKVRRTEERTRGAVKRARAQLQAAGVDPDEELEGTWAHLHGGDGGGSPNGGVPALPEGMDPVSPEAQGQAPTYRELGLMRKYGNA